MKLNRTSEIKRRTAETDITLTLQIDGTGVSTIATGVGFFDHMLTLFAKHAGVDMTLEAKGDLEVDAHHTVEDVGICLGQSLRESLGEKRGIRRYGHFTLPMDETLVDATVDFGGRPYFVFNVEFAAPKIGEFDAELVREFWCAVAMNAGCNLHVNMRYGTNGHHIAEAVFKSTARAMKMAFAKDGMSDDIPSTKGVI
jgi:imidazoleglycerol-phosphate dehydratase